jgi:hypothetical protein
VVIRVYVNSDGQVVSSSAAGAMQAYDLSMDMYTALGANPDNFFTGLQEISIAHTINAFTTYDWRLKRKS